MIANTFKASKIWVKPQQTEKKKKEYKKINKIKYRYFINIDIEDK